MTYSHTDVCNVLMPLYPEYNHGHTCLPHGGLPDSLGARKTSGWGSNPQLPRASFLSLFLLVNFGIFHRWVQCSKKKQVKPVCTCMGAMTTAEGKASRDQRKWLWSHCWESDTTAETRWCVGGPVGSNRRPSHRRDLCSGNDSEIITWREGVLIH